MIKEPIILLTCHDVLDEKFYYWFGLVFFAVQLDIAFILRTGDVITIQESHERLWKLEEFYLNENNTVSIYAIQVE